MVKGDRRLKLDRRLRVALIVILVLASLLLFYKKLLIFTLILFGGGVLQFMTYRGEIKFSLGHIFFLAMVVASLLGAIEGILLLVLAGFVPKMLSGDMDLKSILILPLEALFVVLVPLLRGFELSYLGAMFALINYSLAYMLAKTSGESIAEIIAETGLPLAMNLVYFFSLYQPLASVIGRVIAV